MADTENEEIRIRRQLELFVEEREEARKRYRDLQQAAQQDAYELRQELERRIDRQLSSPWFQASPWGQRILSGVLALILGVGAVGYHETDKGLRDNAAAIERVRLEEEQDEQRIEGQLTDIRANREHRGSEHEHLPETHEQQSCFCENEKTKATRSCWMGAPCDPTSLSLCQHALPEWKCQMR